MIFTIQFIRHKDFLHRITFCRIFWIVNFWILTFRGYVYFKTGYSLITYLLIPAAPVYLCEQPIVIQ